MFYHSKRSNIMFLILAGIALVVLVLIGILLFKISQKPLDPVIQTQDTALSEDPIVPESKTSEELAQEQETIKQDYVNAVLALRAQAESSSDSLEVILSQVEDGLLAIRVPKVLQDVHLNAVLEISRLRVHAQNSPEGVFEHMLAVLLSVTGK